MSFFFNSNFYIFTLILQAVCAIHCMRKGNHNKWIWIIVCLPLVGSIAYIFTEMFTNRDMQQVTYGVSTIINPTGKIRKLEAQLRFSDTFNNRVMLADAYLENRQVNEAIELYESSLHGNFTENGHVIKQLILAYYQQQRFEKIITATPKVYNKPEFARSRAHIYYAVALANTGHIQKAEEEFLKLKGRFSNYEARYQYSKFLAGNERMQDARQVLADIVSEESHLSSPERRANRQWIIQAKQELKRLSS
jgi:hypothetical protein